MRRVRKAVIKEKDIDLGYKLELLEQMKRAELKFEYQGAVIIFTLKMYDKFTVDGVL